MEKLNKKAFIEQFGAESWNEELKRRYREYYNSNKEYFEEYRKNNLDKYAARSRKYYHENKENVSEYHKAYYLTHKKKGHHRCPLIYY